MFVCVDMKIVTCRAYNVSTADRMLLRVFAAAYLVLWQISNAVNALELLCNLQQLTMAVQRGICGASSIIVDWMLRCNRLKAHLWQLRSQCYTSHPCVCSICIKLLFDMVAD